MCRTPWAVCAFLGLGACVPSSSPDITPKAAPIPHQMDARGIQLLDRPQRIDFGRTDHSAERAVSKLVANQPSERGTCSGGDALFASWPDGTMLVYRGGNFVGWERNGARAGVLCRA